MEKIENATILTRESVNEAAKIFLPASQAAKNKHIDKMFATCPTVLQFLRDLDKGHPNEANKEIIVQLLAIFFTAATVQKINLKNFDFDEIVKALERNVALKRYFHNKSHPFDGQAFNVFVQQHPQKRSTELHFFCRQQPVPRADQRRTGRGVHFLHRKIRDGRHALCALSRRFSLPPINCAPSPHSPKLSLHLPYTHPPHS
jgi:hypothetical protein